MSKHTSRHEQTHIQTRANTHPNTSKHTSKPTSKPEQTHIQTGANTHPNMLPNTSKHTSKHASKHTSKHEQTHIQTCFQTHIQTWANTHPTGLLHFKGDLSFCVIDHWFHIDGSGWRGWWMTLGPFCSPQAAWWVCSAAGGWQQPQHFQTGEHLTGTLVLWSQLIKQKIYSDYRK